MLSSTVSYLAVLFAAEFLVSAKAIGRIRILNLTTLAPPTSIPKIFPSKCYEGLGCFSNGPPYFSVPNRPVSLLPQDVIDTKFLLYKRPDKNNFADLQPNLDSLTKSGFDSSLQTKVLIHGYSVTIQDIDFLFQLKDKLLDYGDYNVIFVNWTQSNESPSSSNPLTYPQAFANARVVGAQVARLLQFIKDNKGIDFATVHILGHSLGAHVAGWAGERVKSIGRISGMDPAGPYFYDDTPLVRLDTTDASFVDCIHTDGGTNIVNGKGLLVSLGNSDFFPNGGSSQPGCDDNEQTVLGVTIRQANSCSHAQVVYLYTASIFNDQCAFTGVACDSWDKYQKGECANGFRTEMGYHATLQQSQPKGQKYYLKTSAESPYCIASS